MRGLPKSPVLRRFALSHFLLEVQFWFPVWMLFLTHRGFDLTTMVLADGVFRTTMVALEFPMGLLSDRMGRRRTYLLICGLAILTYAGILMVTDVYWLFGVWIVWGIFWALSSGAVSAYLYEITVEEGQEEKMVGVFGYMRAVSSAAALLSHLLAGFLFAHSPDWPFWVNGIFAVGAFTLAWTLPDTSRKNDEYRPTSFREFISFPRRNPVFLAGSALLAISLIYFWSPRILMQPLFLELDISPVKVSLVYFFYALAGILAGVLAERFLSRLGGRRAIFLGIFLIWLGVLLVGAVPGQVALLFFPLLSFGFYLSNTLLEVSLHHQLENRYRASLLSAVSFLGGVFIIFTRPGLGLLADWRDTPFAFLVWAGLGLVVLVVSARLTRRLEGFRT